MASCNDSKQNKNADSVVASKERIAFVTNRDGNSEIYLMDADGNNLENLTNNDALDFSPSWSITNSLLYFYSKRDGNAEIYSLDLDSKKVAQLSNNQANDVLPVPSPNGEQLLFISDRDSLSKNLYLMDADGSNVKSLTKINSMRKVQTGPLTAKK